MRMNILIDKVVECCFPWLFHWVPIWFLTHCLFWVRITCLT